MPLQTFTDPAGVHNPGANIAPATWFTTLEADFRSLRSRPGAIIRASASQSFTAGSNVQATMGTVVFDVGSYTGTANQITVPAGWAGKYLIAATARIDTLASGAHFNIVAVYLNAVTVLNFELVHATGAGAVFTASISSSLPYPLAVGDHLRLYVQPEATATSPDSEVGNVFPTLSAFWLAP